MASLRFIPLDQTDLSTIEEWYLGDLEGQKFLGGYDNKKILKLANGRDRLIWLVRQDDIAIGFVDLEIRRKVGFPAYFVAKRQRGKGLGTQILLELENLAKRHGAQELQGSFEPETIGSRRAHEKAGHTISATIDEEGMLKASKKI